MLYRAGLMVCLLLLVGCQGPLGVYSLDREVNRLIVDTQKTTLGADAPLDPRPVPSRTVGHAAGDLYNSTPPTHNPSIKKDLPARTDDTATAPTAEPPVQLDLADALAFAITHSREYRRQKEDLFLTALAFLSERHLWGPRFFDTMTSAFTGTPESGDHDQAFTLINELKATQRLPYGGEVSVAALVNLVEQLRSGPSGDLEDAQSASIVFDLTLPLMRGAGYAAREDLIQAGRNLVYAARDFERFRREFLVRVSTDYYELLRQLAQIDNLEHQLENFDWLSRRIEALADAGREPYFEVQRAQAQSLFARNNLVNAREAYANALDAFKILIGMPTTQPVDLTAAQVLIPNIDADPRSSVQDALSLRLDLQTLRDRTDDAARRVRVADNNTLPDLDLFAGATLPTDPGKKRSGIDLDAGSGSYTAGVTLGLPLDRRVEQLNHRGALVDLERAARDYTLRRDRVALEVRSAIRGLEQARSTLSLQNRNITIARKRLRGVVLRLRELGPRDFIEAQDDLLDALNSRDEAQRDLRVSVLQYLVATGYMRVSADGQWMLPAVLTAASPPDEHEAIYPVPTEKPSKMQRQTAPIAQ